MKKGLSVLLVASALFGFYGGAVNLNDILACKDYWEEAGEKSTADMNKLEDGLNQLKDNEQAYLDGLDQVEQGEKDLAQGEADYAAGQAELAQGEADYAAAPGKLAAGERKLAAGKKKLADGYAQREEGRKTLVAAIASRAKLKDAKRKIEDVQAAYNPWLQKFGALRASIVDNPENPTKGVLFDVGATAKGLQTVKAGFDTVEQTGKDGVATIEGLAKGGVRDAIAKQVTGNPDATYNDLNDQQKSAVDGKITDEMIQQAIENNATLKTKYAEAKGAIQLAGYLKITYGSRMDTPANSILGKVGAIQTAEYQATQLRDSSFGGDLDDADSVLSDLLADPMVTSHSDSLAQLIGGAKLVQGYVSDAKDSTATYNENYDELKPNAKLGNNIGDKVADAAEAILSTPDIKAGLTAVQQQALKPYLSSNAITHLDNIELLYGTMTLGPDKKDDGEGSLLDSLNAIKTAVTGGVQQYDAGITAGEAALKDADAQLAQGEKDLAAGKAELAKGYADYKAAPGKLAAGREALAEGLQKLMDGRKQLAAGKDQLAQYEDGEQQVRDGLATLVGTEADLDLESILDRLNGDSDFDNGDKHLELDEGLAAVEVGRGYQAEDGELITKEIMTRAIGTGGLLAAGVLAVLAAILSFLKKNKGAGVFAILSAIAGAFGAFEATQAGAYFSSIAGSTVGQSGMIAAGILAVVALVHSIAHFTAKKEEA